MPMPMLADFAVRLAAGLAVSLLAIPWRLVPPVVFRTQCQIVLALLVLAALAAGRGVPVSRGESVEIGGGFRVPEVMEQSGARLVDVGTTNRSVIATEDLGIGNTV